MTDHRTTHRYIPEDDRGRHGAKTACGIKLLTLYGNNAEPEDGGQALRVSQRGEKLDCPRCLRVLRIRQPEKAD